VFLRLLGRKASFDQSTSTRLALVFSVFASAFTRFAIRAGIETLCRTDFSVFAMKPVYTTLHHNAPN
jgi:hypothetical protein